MPVKSDVQEKKNTNSDMEPKKNALKARKIMV